jgi:HK97 family phage portal protein
LFGYLLGLDARASLENPSVSLTDPDAWEALFGDTYRSASGQKVTKKRALMCAAVWAAISLISGHKARLPLELRKWLTKEKTGSTIDEPHAAYRIVRQQFHDELPAFFGWRQLMLHKLLYTNAYAFIDQDAPGKPYGLYPLLPDRTAPERLKKKALVDQGIKRSLAAELDGQLVYVTETNGRLMTLFPSQVLHLRGLSMDGYSGCDLVEHAKHTIGLALAQERFASLFFRNGARKGGILELPASLKKETKDKVEDGFRKSYENEDAWFKTFVARDNVKFHEAAFNPHDSQLVEASQAQIRQVALFFKLQPSKLGLSDSVAYNSKAEDNQSFLDDTLGDELAMIEAECGHKLLSQQERDESTHFFQHDTRPLLRLDQTKRAAANRMAVGRPWKTVNEARAEDNLPPKPGGDELASASPGAPAANKPADEDSPGNDQPPGDGGDNVGRARLVFAIGQRARHKAKKGQAFRDWVIGAALAEELRAEPKLLAELRAAADLVDDDLPPIVERIFGRHESLAAKGPQ